MKAASDGWCCAQELLGSCFRASCCLGEVRALLLAQLRMSLNPLEEMLETSSG